MSATKRVFAELGVTVVSDELGIDPDEEGHEREASDWPCLDSSNFLAMC